jgi:hypothetical protein
MQLLTRVAAFGVNGTYFQGGGTNRGSSSSPVKLVQDEHSGRMTAGCTWCKKKLLVCISKANHSQLDQHTEKSGFFSARLTAAAYMNSWLPKPLLFGWMLTISNRMLRNQIIPTIHTTRIQKRHFIVHASLFDISIDVCVLIRRPYITMVVLDSPM